MDILILIEYILYSLDNKIHNGEKKVKLEVLGDKKTLYPNVVETITAAENLEKENHSASN